MNNNYHVTLHTGGVPEEARAIRMEVFVEEQGFQEEFDHIDDIALHLLVWDGDTPIATGRTFPTGEGCYAIGRVAVRKAARGLGIGRIVVEGLEKAAADRDIHSTTLSAQVRVQGFYEALGYRPEGETYLDEGCPHIRMNKTL